jgi:hypothetical protein
MIRVQNRDRLLVLIAVIACGLALPAGAQPYYLTDLGAVAPGLAINNSGQVSLLNGYYSGGTYTLYPASFTAGAVSPNGIPPASGFGGGWHQLQRRDRWNLQDQYERGYRDLHDRNVHGDRGAPQPIPGS